MKVTMLRKVVNLADWYNRYGECKVSSNNDRDEAVIKKKITLGKQEFEDFCKDFFAYNDHIKENLDFMRKSNGVWHCIELTAEDSNISVLVESEGYEYARYTAVINKKK